MTSTPIRTETNRRRAELLRRLAADFARRPGGGLIERLSLDVFADECERGQLFAPGTSPPCWPLEAQYARQLAGHVEGIFRRTPGPFTATWAREAREWLMECEQRAAVEFAEATRRSNQTTEVTR